MDDRKNDHHRRRRRRRRHTTTKKYNIHRTNPPHCLLFFSLHFLFCFVVSFVRLLLNSKERNHWGLADDHSFGCCLCCVLLQKKAKIVPCLMMVWVHVGCSTHRTNDDDDGGS